MKKFVLVFSIVFMLIGTLTSCQSKTENQEGNSKKSILAQMQEYKIK